MHSNMEITDEFYSVFSNDELQSRISTLGKEHSEKSTNQETIKVLKDLLAQLEKARITKYPALAVDGLWKPYTP